MANHITIELTRGALDVPPYIPIVAGDLVESHWIHDDPIFARAHDAWKKLQLPHNRPPTQPISFQAFVLYYLRFMLARDLSSAWAHFGGIAAQLSHIGALLSIETTENATTAILYDKAIRAVIGTNSRKRISDDRSKKLSEMSTKEHDSAKRQSSGK